MYLYICCISATVCYLRLFILVIYLLHVCYMLIKNISYWNTPIISNSFVISIVPFHSCSPEHLLGDGSFGSVYRAKYKDQAVAVKVYNTVGDVHPHKMLRQEVTILRHLKHPSLISMLGVGTQPRVVVLELASMGSLGSMLKAGRALGRGLQHRIALQVIEGLMYLHQHMIIYRDLKPDNVLLFNLSMGVQVRYAHQLFNGRTGEICSSTFF